MQVQRRELRHRQEDKKTFHKTFRLAFWIPLLIVVILAATLILEVRSRVTSATTINAIAILLAAGLALFERRQLLRLSRSLDQALNTAEANAAEAHSQNDWLHTTLTSIGDALIATDAQGFITLMNPVAEQLTGWSLEEAKGKSLNEVFHIANEETREAVENPVDQVRSARRIVGLANHTILIKRSGVEISIDDSAAPITGPDGKPTGVILIFRDVTEQRKAQRAAAQLAAIVEYSGDAIATKNLQGMIQTWNAGAERLFGYKASEIIGKSVSVLLPPERLREEDEIIQHLRDGKPSQRLETVRLAKDGRRIPVSVNVSPIRDAEGSIIGASKVIHDITELHAKREALVRERQLLERTLTSIGDAVIVTDAAGRVTLLNAAAEQLTGWKAFEATGRDLQDVFRIVNEQTRQPAESPVDKVLRLGTVVGLANHTVLLAKDGREIPIDDSASPVRHTDGKLFGVVLVFRDFSERKAMEAELRERARRSAADLEATQYLLNVGTACARPSGSFKECLSEILEAAIALTRADKGSIQLLHDPGVLEIAAQKGFDEPFLRFFGNVAANHASACSAAIRTHQRTIVEDVTRNEVFADESSVKTMLQAGVLAMQSTPLTSSSGKLLGVISTHFRQPHKLTERELQLLDLLALQVADYLERKQAEAALRERTEELAAMVEKMPALVWQTHDPQCRSVTGNTAASKLLDVSPDQNVSQTSEHAPAFPVRNFDGTGRELQPEELPMQRAAARGEAVENVELRLVLPDGRTLWIFGGAVPLFSADGKVRGVIGSFFDMTHRKLAEQRLSEQAALLELAWDAIIVRDESGTIQYWNQGAEELYGWSREEALGKVTHQLFQTRFPEPLPEIMKWAREKKHWQGELVHRGKNGEPITVLSRWAVMPAHEASGQLMMMEVNTDITRRKQLEAALQSNEKLTLAGRLSASIAHEIHNPLDAVMNILFLLNRKVDGQPEARHLVELAQAELSRVTEISRNMLSLYRESRAPARVNFSELLKTAVALIQQTVGKNRKNIELRLGFDGELEAFPADLRQVFTNLVKNAVEATTPDGQIRIFSQAMEQNGTRGVLVRIVDNGVGIPVEIRPQLFTPFVTSKEEQGTGLGLWVSRNIVERHGGTIAISTKSEGQETGTTVSVFLPLKFVKPKSSTDHASKALDLKV